MSTADRNFKGKQRGYFATVTKDRTKIEQSAAITGSFSDGRIATELQTRKGISTGTAGQLIGTHHVESAHGQDR